MILTARLTFDQREFHVQKKDVVMDDAFKTSRMNARTTGAAVKDADARIESWRVVRGRPINVTPAVRAGSHHASG